MVAAMSKGRGAAKLAATSVMDVPSWSIRPAQEDTVIESSLESGDRGQAATQWLATVESGARAGDGDGSGSFDNMYEAYWQDKLKDVPPGQVVDVDETCRMAMQRCLCTTARQRPKVVVQLGFSPMAH